MENRKEEHHGIKYVSLSKGNFLFAEMAKIAKEKGEGFVSYYWPKPGEEEPVRKLSFVKLFPEWGWIVGTGIYIDDIEKAMVAQRNSFSQTIAAQRLWIIAISLAMIMVAGVVISFLSKKLSAPIVNAARMLRDIAEAGRMA